MNNELMKICYEGESGTNDIRTCYVGEILHISLSDIFVVLTKENVELGEKNPVKYIPNLVLNQVKLLDEDEMIRVPIKDPRFKDEAEVFVTQPGLNRIMATNSSKAAKKFQRWLYHEVIPSLTKHGEYPPPETTQGSALSQMAEILAQNSRALADAIIRQDQLEAQVNNVSERIDKLENQNQDLQHIKSVRQWFDSNDIAIHSNKELEIVNWCENLSLKLGEKRHPCPSGDRLNAKFSSKIIIEAKNLVEKSKG